MSEVKNTPGPWFVEEVDYSSSSFYIRGTDGKGHRMSSAKGAVAHLPRSTVMPSEANARLIAATPDLLEALEACADWLSDSNSPASLREQVNSAISKATGSQS